MLMNPINKDSDVCEVVCTVITSFCGFSSLFSKIVNILKQHAYAVSVSIRVDTAASEMFVYLMFVQSPQINAQSVSVNG